MSYKEHIPRFFLYTGSILIFISIFLEWDIITNIMTGETTIDYGYNREEVIILFIISFIPIILYEKGIRVAVYYFLLILIEIVVFSLSNRMYAAIYSVESGVGYYFTLIGGLFQLIGMIAIIIIERIKRKSSPPILS